MPVVLLRSRCSVPRSWSSAPASRATPSSSCRSSAELPALGALVLLLIPAYFVLRAEDPRRFVVAAVGAVIVWFVAFYPNIASLPVPTPLSQIHLGLLPTWNWGFQFAVNMDEPVSRRARSG